jgi:hypothetical protein
MCVIFSNDTFGQAVRITAIRLAGDQVMLSNALCPSNDDNIQRLGPQECAIGVSLAPHGPGCHVGIDAAPDGSASQPVEFRGTIRLVLKTRCTSAASAPCSDDELAATPPTLNHPVDVTWLDKGGEACVQLGAPGEPFCPNGP